MVLFSGGQDSVTCLVWALAQGWRAQTIGFDYGQRHKIELECRATFVTALRQNFPRWEDQLGEDHLIDLGVIAEISDSALTQERAIAMRADGLPNGCGDCPACELRRNGYQAFVAERAA